MKDVVVGFITGYTFDKIKPWVNSLDRCGFTGDKYIVCYDIDNTVMEELSSRNYKVVKADLNGTNIVLSRFKDLWHLFTNVIQKDYRYLITTDVKDVVFQSNPSEWLEKNINDKKINVACESIHYKNEPWGDNNLRLSFGDIVHKSKRNNLIVNAGTISGEFRTMLDLALNIYFFCGRSPEYVSGGGGPDQAALNVLLSLEPYKSMTNVAMSESGYAAQLGTTGPQVYDKFKQHLVEPVPIFKDGLVCTSEGIPFSIVHQYDRVPEWKNIIEEKYA